MRRVRVRVSGTVQGVGFRPFVYREAVELGLAGWVANDGGGAVLEVEGSARSIQTLLQVLRASPPPLAIIAAVAVEEVPPTGQVGFDIAGTLMDSAVAVPVSVDVAPCSDCLREMADPADRRFRYPFINCTNCGPRYTIVKAVPYDRATTTMSGFTMCGRCQHEYDDPTDRRFHAQPNACPACGPRLTWSTSAGGVTETAALEAATTCLLSGGIVGVKGVGGYHVACDAANSTAVETLRRRKGRAAKPFAVMVARLDEADLLCELGPDARVALTSAARPIVLAAVRRGVPIDDAVAPGLDELGVALPSSPLHVLLMEAVGRPLVMTSGNRTDEPITYDDTEARSRLAPLVDGFLTHDRAIHVSVDDSVVRVGSGGRPKMVRRARGLAPQPVALPVRSRLPLLAVGAQLKSTVTLARGGSAVTSQHLGDLQHYESYRAFQTALRHLIDLSGVAPELVVHDLHPGYLSSSWARDCGLPLLGVQHHHAHIAACMVEHGRAEKVLGIAYDGLGMGNDGTLWGGELFVADLVSAERVGHLLPVSLPGGDAATREPWRMALSWLHHSMGVAAASEHGRSLDDRWRSVLGLVKSPKTPQTSSVGRLFDAVASLLDVRQVVTYEGQAAIELEALAHRAGTTSLRLPAPSLVRGVLDPAPLLVALVHARKGGAEPAALARAFHVSLAESSAELSEELASAHGLDTVALSGGVFQNVLFTTLLATRLRARGLQVLTHERFPSNDGSISLGQAAIAAARDLEPGLPAAGGT